MGARLAEAATEMSEQPTLQTTLDSICTHAVIGFRAGWGLGNALFIATALATIVSAASGSVAQAIILFEAALGLGIAALHAPDRSVVVLAVAYLTMAVYDVWGKRSAVPVLTDLVQGLSWAALLWWGASATGRPSG